MKRKIWFFLALVLTMSIASSALAGYVTWAEMSTVAPEPIEKPRGK